MIQLLKHTHKTTRLLTLVKVTFMVSKNYVVYFVGYCVGKLRKSHPGSGVYNDQRQQSNTGAEVGQSEF